jgi:hypothetical protein
MVLRHSHSGKPEHLEEWSGAGHGRARWSWNKSWSAQEKVVRGPRWCVKEMAWGSCHQYLEDKWKIIIVLIHKFIMVPKEIVHLGKWWWNWFVILKVVINEYSFCVSTYCTIGQSNSWGGSSWNRGIPANNWKREGRITMSSILLQSLIHEWIEAMITQMTNKGHPHVVFLLLPECSTPMS